MILDSFPPEFTIRGIFKGIQDSRIQGKKKMKSREAIISEALSNLSQDLETFENDSEGGLNDYELLRFIEGGQEISDEELQAYEHLKAARKLFIQNHENQGHTLFS